MARPKGSKNKPAPAVQEVTADAPEAGEVSVTYLGAAPVVFAGYVFCPGEPVAGLPETLIDGLRLKAVFKVSNER